jgi:hypothetical protein
MDEGLGFDSSNQLGIFGERLSVYFSRGKEGPYVDEVQRELEKRRNIILKVAWWEEIWRCWEN